MSVYPSILICVSCVVGLVSFSITNILRDIYTCICIFVCHLYTHLVHTKVHDLRIERIKYQNNMEEWSQG